MLNLHPGDRECAGTRDTQARHAALAWCWRPQLARHTTVARRRRDASRRHGALLQSAFRAQPARHGASEKEARVLRLLPRYRECRCACAEQDTRRWLGVEDRSWHVEPRPHADGEMPLAGTAPFYEVSYGQNQPAAARARSKPACYAATPPPQRQRAQVRLR